MKLISRLYSTLDILRLDFRIRFNFRFFLSFYFHISAKVQKASLGRPRLVDRNVYKNKYRVVLNQDLKFARSQARDRFATGSLSC